MAKVGWSRRSLLDLRDIQQYIAQFDPQAADRIKRRLKNAGNGLTIAANRGRVYQQGVRVLATVRPYLIFYKVEGDSVVIIHVRHSSRRPFPA